MILFVKKIFPLILLVIISLLYSRPLLRQGYFPTHDGQWSVIRLAEMQRELKDGQIPPRWSGFLNHGYGYPLFHFTYPFPYYVGILPRLMGFGYVESVKIIFILSIVVSSLAMFFLGKELAGSFGGFTAAVFYISAPYRLVNLYVRGSLGESLAFAVIPLLFLTTLKYVVKPTSARLSIAAISLSVLILTHNVTALVVFPIFIAFYFALVRTYFEDTKKYLRRFVLLCGLGFGIAAYFFLPALSEKHLIALSKIPLSNIDEHFIGLREFIFSPWNYGIRPTFALGWFHVITALVSITVITVAGRVQWKKYLPVLVFIISMITMLIFFTNSASKDFWKFSPLSWIDFPWRLLTPLSFLLSLTTIFMGIRKKIRWTGIVLGLVAAIMGLRFAAPSGFFDKPDEYYFTNDATTTSADELMPLWVKEKPTKRYTEKVEVIEGNGIVSQLHYTSDAIQFLYETESPSRFTLNTIYFPGWFVNIDGRTTDIDFKNDRGVMTILIPEGLHKVEGYFGKTPIRAFAELVTLASTVLVIFLFLKPFMLRVIKKDKK